jgi:hypothetical protein
MDSTGGSLARVGATERIGRRENEVDPYFRTKHVALSTDISPDSTEAGVDGAS